MTRNIVFVWKSDVICVTYFELLSSVTCMTGLCSRFFSFQYIPVDVKSVFMFALKNMWNNENATAHSYPYWHLLPHRGILNL